MAPGESDENAATFLQEVAKLKGFYVPSLYGMENDGSLRPGAVVKKRLIKDLDHAIFPTKPLVPHTEIVHDRGVLELFRGCVRGCRFVRQA